MAVDDSFKTPPQPNSRFGKKDWDEVRFSFATSLMVDTKLRALAQNLEVDDWPLKGDNETPSKYIDFTWDELKELPGLAGRPERIDQLIALLKETQSFDDPFGDMVATVDAAATKNDELSKNLRHMGIPQEYPLRMSGLSAETLEFCETEEIQTIGDFASFSQTMAQNVIVGGDFRELLNGLASSDERMLSKFLPCRPGHKGLFFPEAIGLLLNQLSDNERYSLLKKHGYRLSDREANKARLSREQVSRLEDIIVERIRELSIYFTEQIKELYAMLKRGVKMERYFMTLNDPEKEAICVPLAHRFIEEEAQTLKDSVPGERKRGFFSRLFGR
jgi:hypothetical protein